MQARADGAVAFEGARLDGLDEGQAGPGFPIEVFNVLGAGDGLMSELLKRWLDGEDWPVALKYANACGAFVVSRHGCTPAYPRGDELQLFFGRGIVRPDLRHDRDLEQVHWATNRQRNHGGDWSQRRVFDHRAQIKEMEGYAPAKGGALPQRSGRSMRRGRPG